MLKKKHVFTTGSAVPGSFLCTCKLNVILISDPKLMVYALLFAFVVQHSTMCLIFLVVKLCGF